MIATTIEQSKHLLELGLDPKTADCNWNTTFGNWSLCIGKNKLPHAVSSWSLSALLEVMPTTIEIDGLRYDLELFKAIDDDTDLPYYGVRYVYNDDYHLDYYESGSNIIEQAFAMVCILLENGYIKERGNQ